MLWVKSWISVQSNIGYTTSPIEKSGQEHTRICFAQANQEVFKLNPYFQTAKQLGRMANQERSINLTDKTLTGIRVEPPADYAAGPLAVKVAMKHVFDEMEPVAAMKALFSMNQKKGFDCPGCAWPDPDDKRSVLGEYCENGAKALAEEATTKKVDYGFFSQYTLEEISNWSDYKIGKSGRLTEPMICRSGDKHYQPISWDKAFLTIADQLNKLDSPNKAIFYTSGRSSNEAAYLYALFIRKFGTNNMPDCSNMCHESSGVALSQTLGIGKGSVTLDDLEHAEVAMIIGQNPGTNHPRMLSALQKLKLNGGKVITVNPLEEAGLKRFKNPQKISGFLSSGTMITDVFLQVKVNQDIPLLKAIMKKLIALDEGSGGNVLDHKFISERTSGFEAVKQDLKQHDIQDLIHQSGVPEKEINKAVEILRNRKKIIICWAMGLTQHKNGVENIKECVNLLLMKGSIGKPGAGTCPVRGHSNVQGDRTVGIVHHTSEALRASLMKKYGFESPMEEGLDTVHSIQAMYEGKAKVFMALGGNFLSAASDTEYTAKALSNCDLTVHVSTKLNRSHTVPGKTSIILPTLGRSELDIKGGKPRFVTVENSMGKVHSSQGVLKPASDKLMSEPEIVCRLAHAVFGKEDVINWMEYAENYDLIREDISEVIQGFEDYNQRLNGGGFYLPNNARKGDFSKLPEGKAQFTVCGLPRHDLAEDEFLMMTIRSHDQFNTTIYGLNDRYRGVYNERRVVFMNSEDCKKMGLSELDQVDLTSEYDGVTRKAEQFLIVQYDIPAGNIATYFPETNVLVPINHFADHSHTPISKSIKVRVEKLS